MQILFPVFAKLGFFLSRASFYPMIIPPYSKEQSGRFRVNCLFKQKSDAPPQFGGGASGQMSSTERPQ
jgi:hypothetical protein